MAVSGLIISGALTYTFGQLDGSFSKLRVPLSTFWRRLFLLWIANCAVQSNLHADESFVQGCSLVHSGSGIQG